MGLLRGGPNAVRVFCFATAAALVWPLSPRPIAGRKEGGAVVGEGGIGFFVGLIPLLLLLQKE